METQKYWQAAGVLDTSRRKKPWIWISAKSEEKVQVQV